jgi:hypothetical protein
MAQVSVVVLNGEFSPRRISALKIVHSYYGKRTHRAGVGRRAPADGQSAFKNRRMPCGSVSALHADRLELATREMVRSRSGHKELLCET